MATDIEKGQFPKNRIQALLLRRNPSGKIGVDPRDSVRFDIQREKAARLLRMMDHAEQFEKQFSLLLDVLGRWIGDNDTKIKAAYLTMQNGILSFVVVQVAAEYDGEFEDSLTDLEFAIANDADLNLISMTTMPLPPVSEQALRSFIDESLLLQYVG